ncbi:glutathione S-transferase family protein [Roseococcus sp. SYP-B2431]|uniref:glutathione S-transferase family protein n=1 Tax=Roseococcus sp. SYP-B2431 TaxID=2496640 RepID=UPI00103D46B7|nr:glutathione S-transferase family protein [Roseococcus sp. SYP-B2431]TCH99829.1 glutathione S-transferase family protein [Roseococcus sp. SYP-B2431]
MTRYRLHYFPESGNSYKLALMLTLCGQSFEPVWTDFGGGVTRTEAWRRTVNPMGEIPVLEEDGEKLTQTAPILLRLAGRYGRFGAETEAERFEILRWLFWDNQKLTGFMATYRFRRAFLPPGDPAVMEFLKSRLEDFLGILERQVADRPFVLGERATILDISMCAYLSFPREEAGFDFAASHPAIQAWLGRIAALPGWKSPYELLPGQRMRRYV